MSDARAQEPDIPTGRTAVRGVLWLLASIALVAGTSFAATSMNPTLTRLAVFGVALGGVAGWLLGRLARGCRFDARRSAVLLGFLLIIAGQLLYLGSMHRAYAHDVRADYAVNPLQMVLKRGSIPEDPKVRQQYETLIEENERARAKALKQKTSLQAFLKRRRSQSKFGEIPAPWVYVVSAIEVLAAGALGAFVLSRSLAVR